MLKRNIIILTIIIVLGMSGCMNKTNRKVTLETMKQYAEEKYGQEFEVTTFQEARDYTYSNILSLTDGDVVFNVFQSENSNPGDDYPGTIISKKLERLLKEQSATNLDVFADFMALNGSEMTLEYANRTEAEDIISQCTLKKIIVVVRVDGELPLFQDELYRIYRTMLSFNPEIIDFEVLQAPEMSTKLANMLQNIPGLYEKKWSSFSEIKAYIGVSSKDITSADELVGGIK